MFSKTTYTERRAALRQLVGHGLILIFGNNDSPVNYPANAYKFRQDSSFLYFFGQKRDGLVGVIDADSAPSPTAMSPGGATRSTLTTSYGTVRSRVSATWPPRSVWPKRRLWAACKRS